MFWEETGEKPAIFLKKEHSRTPWDGSALP